MFRSHNKTENSVPYTSNTFEKPYSMDQEAKNKTEQNNKTKQEAGVILKESFLNLSCDRLSGCWETLLTWSNPEELEIRGQQVDCGSIILEVSVEH